MTTKAIATLKTAINTDLPDNISGAISPADVRLSLIDLIDSSIGVTGWADYIDNQYSSGSPFLMAASIPTKIPNNAATKQEQELPYDAGVNGFYNSTTGKILNIASGDSMLITPEFTVERQSGSGSFSVDYYIDIGGLAPDLYKRTLNFKGTGSQNATTTTAVYCLDTWLANGAELYLVPEVPIKVYGIRFVIHRLHKGRGTYPPV